jgi:heat shock protein HslJ
MPAHKSLAEAGVFCKSRAMGKTPTSRRNAVPLWAAALLCSVHGGFAQSPPDAAALIGKWELFSVSGSETTIPREKMEITAKTLEVMDNCNEQSYTYAIKDGEMTARPPALISLVACSDETQARNQESIVTAIVHSTVQLNGETLHLAPLPRPLHGELVFLRKLEFRRTE